MVSGEHPRAGVDYPTTVQQAVETGPQPLQALLKPESNPYFT